MKNLFLDTPGRRAATIIIPTALAFVGLLIWLATLHLVWFVTIMTILGFSALAGLVYIIPIALTSVATYIEYGEWDWDWYWYW